MIMLGHLGKNTPLPTGIMEEVVGLVITMGKALSVERADQGAKQGLNDRVRLRRLPPTSLKAYGYSWQTNPQKLVPERCEPMRRKGNTYGKSS